MRFSTKLVLVSAMCVAGLRAEQPVTTSNTALDTPAATTKVKRKHFKWFRRLCAGEVNLAIKLSSIGIPKTEAR